MPRLFTAIEIPQSVATTLSFLTGGLPSARWIDRENYHLTLRFFGDIEPRAADELVEALDRIRRARFSLTLLGLGVFTPKKPHSIYASVEASPELMELQAEIDRIAKRLGLPVDNRKFTPHVTIARLRQPRDRDVAIYLAQKGAYRSPAFEAKRFGLYSSRASLGGGPYVLEEPFHLDAGLGEDRVAVSADAAYLGGSHP
ncbi:RNA 2',3'-cyclic phosphodiesterase [Fulvimarina sp. 2208YS6-2-32]|uniref:RNA 2',3'-cyclic phosphodiesterase n=1 Tax=Fulvimarina uroteuthidis TaxID=3098149 RepID=A0ABU5HX65_9HYPH|nr:RNA 2',3'-cyclic phosphodiesterase [Fulvimarina sp. 2208YS6-2-32]MDY8107630.1 RNA 2',3'-cyclic phosphodiesterase [Fulvimarina sp. 2208YS6-2-32]